MKRKGLLLSLALGLFAISGLCLKPTLQVARAEDETSIIEESSIYEDSSIEESSEETPIEDEETPIEEIEEDEELSFIDKAKAILDTPVIKIGSITLSVGIILGIILKFISGSSAKKLKEQVKGLLSQCDDLKEQIKGVNSLDQLVALKPYVLVLIDTLNLIASTIKNANVRKQIETNLNSLLDLLDNVGKKVVEEAKEEIKELETKKQVF